jgi:hypothetical protein
MKPSAKPAAQPSASSPPTPPEALAAAPGLALTKVGAFSPALHGPAKQAGWKVVFPFDRN